ncbi:hypothetical protein, partial [Klebsiella pneumoniae]|uniref:hypothetical protein n=1 Tax=Klebsiella pneumoniae TaxID=573 RepID=UPI0038518A75
MRYYTEPHTTSKVTVQFHQPYIAVEFFEEMKDQPGVYELKVVGPTVKYWCATREEGVRFSVDFERRWVERHQATAALVAPPAQKLE